MEFKDNTKQIKKALLKGGLVVAGRCSGKTRALSEILVEIPASIVISPFVEQQKQLKKYLKANTDLTEQQIDSKVLLGSDSTRKRLLGNHQDFCNKWLFIDEYYHNAYKGPFFAAVTSFPYKVKVIE